MFKVPTCVLESNKEADSQTRERVVSEHMRAITGHESIPNLCEVKLANMLLRDFDVLNDSNH